MQNTPQQPAGSVGAQPPAKKGLSKGCVIGIVIAVVLIIGLIILLAAGGAGFYWLSKQAANMNGNSTTGTRGSSSATSSNSNDAAEAPQPTDAQTAAVSGGQSAVWDQQEISWTVPQRWTKSDVSSQSFMWRSPGSADAASLIVSVSPMAADFPADVSANAFYEQAQTRKKNGEVEEVRWLRLDGVRGVMFRESAPESSDSPQRLQWIGYRDYKGQKQMVNIMLASRGKDFAHHEDALYGILYSTKWSK
ncbi:MAG: hypothetical protein M3268_03505 [Acidobacteriota bacterium]|nr:hypothetical protein [Acidobacteriota bacterium]